MVNMYLNALVKKVKSDTRMKFEQIQSYAKAHKKTFLTGLVMMLCALPEIALADAGQGTGFLCAVASYFKGIVGTCAVIVIFMWSLEHLFGMSKLHDIVMKVGIVCFIVMGAATLISQSGLSSGCGL